jgi:threonine/homoserine/homoserine lactone efflux protein
MTTPHPLLRGVRALTIAPGPDNIFVLTQGIARGRKAAIVTALGMCSGISVHTTPPHSAFPQCCILPPAFMVLKYVEPRTCLSCI